MYFFQLSKGLAKHLAKKMEPTVTGATGGIGGGKSSTTKSSSMHNIVDAARGGLLAYGTVYASLEESAKVLGKSVKEESVQVVEKKYGKQSGEVKLQNLESAHCDFTRKFSSMAVKVVAPIRINRKYLRSDVFLPTFEKGQLMFNMFHLF